MIGEVGNLGQYLKSLHSHTMLNIEYGILSHNDTFHLYFAYTHVSVFVVSPTDQKSVAQGLILGRSRCRHAWWAQKCLGPHWHSPKKGASGNKPNPFEEGKSLGGQPPEARGCQFLRTHECWLPRFHVKRPRPTATGTRTSWTHLCTEQHGQPKCVPAQWR